MRAAASLFAAALAIAIASPKTNCSAGEVRPAEMRVGVEDGDVRGADNRALQAAVDHVASLGGGVVYIGPGHYHMRNALILRDNVFVCGVPGKTVLSACDGFITPLACDGDCNERQITLVDPSGFRVGDGVVVTDRQYAGGFTVTTATLTAQVDATTFRISAPLYLDYLVSREASASLAFPVVGGWNVKNASVEGLTIDGNRANSQPLGGCRGGGIYLFECDTVAIRNCIVRNYNGDGVSFQVSQHVTVEDSLSENNAGHGLHPGSGSQHPVLRRNRSVANDRDGIFVCWRVKHGLFEQNEARANRGVGISIGHKDTDNLFRDSEIMGNRDAGVEFRPEAEAMGAHRNVFENNLILDNGVSGKGTPPRACVIIRGHHHDLVFRNNTIGNSKPAPAPSVGIFSGKDVERLKTEGNQFPNVATPLVAE
jgi:hypothetical protein